MLKRYKLDFEEIFKKDKEIHIFTECLSIKYSRFVTQIQVIGNRFISKNRIVPKSIIISNDNDLLDIIFSDSSFKWSFQYPVKDGCYMIGYIFDKNVFVCNYIKKEDIFVSDDSDFVGNEIKKYFREEKLKKILE